MDKTVEIEIVAVIGILGGIALILGQNDLALGVGTGLVGYLSHGAITGSTNTETVEKEPVEIDDDQGA